MARNGLLTVDQPPFSPGFRLALRAPWCRPHRPSHDGWTRPLYALLLFLELLLQEHSAVVAEALVRSSDGVCEPARCGDPSYAPAAADLGDRFLHDELEAALPRRICTDGGESRPARTCEPMRAARQRREGVRSGTSDPVAA